MTPSKGLPEPLQRLVSDLATLPGLGPKSALRLALTLLKWPAQRTRDLGQSIVNLRQDINLCRGCGALTDGELCRICADPSRNAATVCLVTDWDALLALENGGFYKGVYLILGGLFSPLDNEDSDGMDLERLRARLNQCPEELILALGTKLEAENTASYIKRLVEAEFPTIAVSRLAQGIPRAADVKDMDQETLRQSLLWRQPL